MSAFLGPLLAESGIEWGGGLRFVIRGGRARPFSHEPAFSPKQERRLLVAINSPVGPIFDRFWSQLPR